jgi:hypothetical protein
MNNKRLRKAFINLIYALNQTKIPYKNSLKDPEIHNEFKLLNDLSEKAASILKCIDISNEIINLNFST